MVHQKPQVKRETGGGTTVDKHMKMERRLEAEAAMGLRLSWTGGK